MATRRHNRAKEAQLGFEAITIEGSLLSPEWLSKVAQVAADCQSESDYRVPKGLNLRDEIGRYWRIAQAHWKEFAGGQTSNVDRAALAERFVMSLLRESFGFTSLARVEAPMLSERSYPIGHAALGLRVPVVIAPAASGIDTLSPTFGDEGRQRSAFGLAQEYLNAAEGAVWGIVTDVSALRILRDNSSLTRPSWIEADLTRIFTEERYADFAALWLLLHETRFGREGQPANECALEAWREAGRKEGTRAREHLRKGVEEALTALGQGFLSHPDNQALRSSLQDGSLSTRDYFRQLLRLVYRLIFLLTVEERNLLHPEGTCDATKALYAGGYALRRLCDRSVKRSAHDRFSDLWDSLKVVLCSLAEGEPRLGLPALAGIFSKIQCPAIDAARLENRALLLALFKLAWLRENTSLSRVNWRDMGSEELGSVYESLLELIPQINEEGRKFRLITAAGNERKTTGSYYTPSSLVECLLNSALDPVVDQRLASKWGAEAEQVILALRLCDPACGSGHFLVAAAHRLGRRLARIRSQNNQPSLAQLRQALREVISHCLYGVDVNPMSVELCKVTLWLEATEPGKPLSFLDHHIQCGNSLLGATPRALRDSLPDDAFKPIEGDDKTVCTEAKKRNKAERQQLALFHGTDTAPWQHLGSFPAAMLEIGSMSDDTAAALHDKEQRYTELVRSTGYLGSRFLANAWCAAFVWKKTRDLPYPITNDVLRKIERNPHDCTPWMREEIERLSDRYQFFHWHLGFPEVFPLPGKGERPTNLRAGWNGGFDVMLGNPPWERVKLQEREWFAASRPDIAEAQTASARLKLIEQLKIDSPAAFAEFQSALRQAESETAFICSSGRFPLGAVGDTNTYPLFIEAALELVSNAGRAGLIVKTGILADYSLRQFFRYLVEQGRFVSALDFSNRKLIFPAVVANERFTLLTLAGGGSSVFQVSILNEEVADLSKVGKIWELTSEDVSLINPNTRTCPLFQTADDARLVVQIYKYLPVLSNEADNQRGNLWGVCYYTMFHMTNDSGLFRDLESLKENSQYPASPVWPVSGDRFIALLEGKLFDLFDHHHGDFRGIDRSTRFGIKAEPNHPTIQDRFNPNYESLPRYWVNESEVRSRYIDRLGFNPGGVLSFRDVCRTHTDFRTVRAAICPALGAGNKAPFLLFPGISPQQHASRSLILCANLGSFVLDYVARQKFAGGSLNKFILLQFPVPPLATYAEPCMWASQPAVTHCNWLHPRVLELTYTAWDLEPFARNCGRLCPPFVWDAERRFLLRCELDAAFFHLYGLNREDTAYVMDTFPIVRKHDEKAHGEYRTKRVILEIYDALAESTRTGTPYQTLLNPPPADPRCCHPPALIKPDES